MNLIQKITGRAAKKSQRRRDQRRRLTLEGLETRNLMAADAGFSMAIEDNNLVIVGTELDDQVFVEQMANDIVRVTGVNEDGHYTQEFNGADFDNIVFNGGEGDDHLYVKESGVDDETPPSEPGDGGQPGPDLDPNAIDLILAELYKDPPKDPAPEDPAPGQPGEGDSETGGPDAAGGGGESDDGEISGPAPGGGSTGGGSTGGGSTGGGSVGGGLGGGILNEPFTDTRRAVIYAGLGGKVDIDASIQAAKDALNQYGEWTSIDVIDARNVDQNTWETLMMLDLTDDTTPAMVFVGHGGGNGLLVYGNGEGVSLHEAWKAIREMGYTSVNKEVFWAPACQANESSTFLGDDPLKEGRRATERISEVTTSWDDLVNADSFFAFDYIMPAISVSDRLEDLGEGEQPDQGCHSITLNPASGYYRIVEYLSATIGKKFY